MSRLTVAKIRSLRKRGRYGDGGTLYLRVAPGGSKSWVQRVTVNGKRCELGLGGWPVTSLAEAREEAMDNRRIVRRGGDPRAHEHKAPTFAEAARRTREHKSCEWSPGHATAWMRSLQKYVFPRFGSHRVDHIAKRDVLGVIDALSECHPQTARRLRIRIRQVFDWCLFHDYVKVNVAGEVIKSAVFKGRPQEQHFRAVHHSEMGDVYRQIDSAAAESSPKLCLLFIILTAVRKRPVNGVLDERGGRLLGAEFRSGRRG